MRGSILGGIPGSDLSGNQQITVRKTIDMLIGTFCIEHGYGLLHADRDYDPMERHLGLQVVR